MSSLYTTSGLSAVGRRDVRKPVLLAATALATLTGPLMWGLVALGVARPAPASDVMALGVFIGFLALLGAPWLPTGRATDRWARLLDMLLLWTVASTGAQVWELSFVAAHQALIGVTGDDTWAWIWWAYGKADTRYLIADPFVVVMEGFTAIFGGAVELWLIVQMKRGRFRRIAPWAIVVGVTQWYGAVLYFGIELFEGLRHVNTGWWVDLWIKFVGLNALWLVLPLVQVWIGFRLLTQRGAG